MEPKKHGIFRVFSNFKQFVDSCGPPPSIKSDPPEINSKAEEKKKRKLKDKIGKRGEIGKIEAKREKCRR